MTLLGLFLASTGSAAVHCVRAGAAGNGSGSDWINAYPSLPGTLVRGDTYYIADGNYGSYTFNTPNSGASVITIKKAIPSDHGPSNGWDDNYGNGQAVFTGPNYLLTHYWVIDGQVRSDRRSGHGFKFASPDKGSVFTSQFPPNDFQSFPNGQTNCASHISWRYCEMVGNMTPNTGPNVVQSTPGNQQYGAVDLSFEHCYLHNAFVFLYTQFADQVLIDDTDCVYNYSTAAAHGEMFQLRSTTNVTVRNSVLDRFTGTYAIGSGSGNSGHWKIYGNVFANGNGGSSMIGDNVGGTITDMWVVNNTFANVTVNAAITWGFQGGTVTNPIVIKNNIWYNCQNVPQRVMSWHDYNVYINSGLGAPFQANAHDVVLNNAPSPFVNAAAGDFRLSAPLSSVGDPSVGSPYNSDPDMLGNIRGADGVWDVGAYEYVVGSPGPVPSATPPPPTPAPTPNPSPAPSATPPPVTPPPVTPPPGTPPPTATPGPSPAFQVGDRVEVGVTPSLRVRVTPALASTILGSQDFQTPGTIVAGPVTVDSYNWWNITYDTGVTGWSIGDNGFLVPSTRPRPPENLRIVP